MAENKLCGIKACVFDAYGTLFDVHSAVGKYRDRLADPDGVSALWRQKQLQYTWLRSLMARYEDFSTVTAQALDFALESFQVNDANLRADLVQAYLELEAYAEVPAMLRALKAKGIRTAILSNGSPKMLAAAVRASGLEAALDAVISVHDLRIYKPDQRVYALASDHFGLPPEAVSFQSSNAWDANGAAVFGFKVVWVNRFAQAPERLPGNPTVELRDLTGLAELVEA